MKSLNDEKIWLSPPHIGEKERSYVEEAFDQNWVAPAGPHIVRFESSIKEYFNVGAVAALSSGTAALHLALINLGVGQGDYVLTQSLTFSASANPIRYLGAEPVFIDSEYDTWNLDPVVLEEAILDLKEKGIKPKAIVGVDLYGMPAKWADIQNISMKYDIPLIEDSAEAAGSTYMGKYCGTFGRMAVLSFNGNKIITTSGGGALLSNDWHLVEHARFLSTQAKDDAAHYQHSHVGYNYRMSNICAGIGCGQMEVLNNRVRRRREIFDFYFDEFRDVEGISLLVEPYGHYSNRWLTAILVDPEKTNGITREHLRLALESRNIESRPLWKPLHLQPVFENHLFYGSNVSQSLFENGLCLPSGSAMTSEQLNKVISVIRKVLSNGAGELVHKVK